MVVKVIENLNTPIEIIDEPAEYSHSCKQFDRSHNAARENSLKPNESWIRYGNTCHNQLQNDKVYPT